MIALNSPLKPDLKRLNQYLETINERGWFTNFGPLHDELTERLQDYLGVENLLLVANGTIALQLAGRALGVDNLITTPFSFVATTSTFQWQKDTLSFADIDRKSYNLCPNSTRSAIDQDETINAVLATHVYGNPCDVENFDSLSKEKNVKVIYDAAHTFGVNVGSKSVLSFGDASTLSFHATKVFHTVEGGAIVFREKQHLENAKRMINFGIASGKGVVETGINGKLSEYQSAVGLVNLANIHRVLEHRARLFDIYRQSLKDSVEIPKWHPEANCNGAYMPILLESREQLKSISEKLLGYGIQNRNYFFPSLDTVFKDCRSFGTSNSRFISERVLCLPLHVNMTIEDVNKVTSTVKKLINIYKG